MKVNVPLKLLILLSMLMIDFMNFAPADDFKVCEDKCRHVPKLYKRIDKNRDCNEKYGPAVNDYHVCQHYCDPMFSKKLFSCLQIYCENRNSIESLPQCIKNKCIKNTKINKYNKIYNEFRCYNECDKKFHPTESYFKCHLSIPSVYPSCTRICHTILALYRLDPASCEKVDSKMVNQCKLESNSFFMECTISCDIRTAYSSIDKCIENYCQQNRNKTQEEEYGQQNEDYYEDDYYEDYADYEDYKNYEENGGF